MTAATTDGWRGVAAEERDELPSGVSLLLRERSRRLLGSLLRPHRRRIWLLVAVVLAHHAAAMAGPYLVKVGIDQGIPRVVDGRGAGRLTAVVAVFLLAAAVSAVTLRWFLLLVGRVGQDLVLDLRTRVFDGLQRLSLGFRERYTSGRVM